jgi:hypothetical protein
VVLHALVPPRPLGTGRLISAGCDALAPLCPGSSTTVIVLGIAGWLVARDGDGVLGGDRVLGDRIDGEAAGAGCGPAVPHAASATKETNTQGRQRSTRPALGLPIREMRAHCVTERDYRPQPARSSAHSAG